MYVYKDINSIVSVPSKVSSL